MIIYYIYYCNCIIKILYTKIFIGDNVVNWRSGIFNVCNKVSAQYLINSDIRCIF